MAVDKVVTVNSLSNLRNRIDLWKNGNLIGEMQIIYGMPSFNQFIIDLLFDHHPTSIVCLYTDRENLHQMSQY